ncbi:PTS sugar transporter subunit IIC [Virgibacillus pantothenticus]|uniref:PTS sugar transporter subunit IIC n=1 Tax=Virgibacillus pantothenticus TaxID=1473 RepID=UPI001C21AD58|nr:PTS sugar transporter subunit IIC [Virgibacillus pantothenticus]MBU8566590.1 PTS sugar transporter subunit IIC [Virgibacillus pantothenticus]MBU8599082.1 PTS sugar transporter subunit IIC [Virgibacillus pantothenticus]MBU8634747.1 PTS sugar transporter subunit IIC [Virgibacillus pantothenticus]MBU8641170.1 PTS sugar transporter subunit IIC [Virgibacillus pantothenticus]MBU8645248.1 PTS sugar transporter subunit IIC [Virgibacillus pantothenticus]
MNSKAMQKFIEIAGRIGSQRHLVAVRDGFVAIMPLIIVGSLAILINNFPPFGAFNFVEWMNGIFGEGNWQAVGGSIWNGTFAILGLLVTFSIAFNLAKSYEVDGLAAGLIAGAGFIMLVPVTSDGGLDMGWLGTQGLFVGIILALVVTELFRTLITSKMTIKMPEGVPDGVTRSFEALIPAVLILILVGFFQAMMTVFAEKSIFEVIFNMIQEPLQGLGNTLPAAMLVSFLNHLLWFFGLHGTNIIGSVIEPVYLPLIEENLNLFKSGMSAFEVPNIVTKPFLDSFVFIGGSGTTIALLIAVFVVIRREKNHPYRQVAKLSAPAGLFNINEPVIFGLPIVLNPVMLIPFILVPVTLTITSYIAIATGLVPRTVAILPWTTPPILSGYLVTGGSFRGVVLQLFNLALAIVMYIPFVMAGARMLKRNEGKAK